MKGLKGKECKEEERGKEVGKERCDDRVMEQGKMSTRIRKKEN